jgi:4-hydroxymandelate oxidase
MRTPRAPAPLLADLVTVRDFERAARRVLSANALGYFRSGADGEATLRANRRAFSRWSIAYRVLVDVRAIDLRVNVLGHELTTPLLIAPTAYHRLAHDDGELATARAATRTSTTYVVSTLATTSLEDVAAASGPGPRWFQLYVHKDRELTKDLVARAEAHGYGAIVLTVDTPILGRRIRDVKNRFALPPSMRMVNLVPEGATLPDPTSASYLAAYVAARHDASLGWKDVEWLQSITRLPIVLKGIVRGDDARLAADAGARGIIVSNHGGRQLDGAPATLDALPHVLEGVASSGREVEVLLDGGIRWGTDVLKALALGARAVLIGRPILWGLALGGEEGVVRVLDILKDELARAMALAGAPDVAALRSSSGGGLVVPSR